MIDDLVRDLMPGERRLSPARQQEIKERLMDEIINPRRPARRGRPRRLIGGLAAVAVLATGGAAAAAIAFNGPDPEQAAQVVRNSEVAAEAHLDGWRPELRAEYVTCVGPDRDGQADLGQASITPASEFPLEEPLTAELLIEECTTGNDQARISGGFNPDAATVCVRGGDYPVPFVALDELRCGDVAAGVAPATPHDLERLNEMRALEVAVLANPNRCPSVEDAADWTRRQLEAAGASLTVRVVDGDDRACYRGWLYWESGEVRIEQFASPATGAGPHGPTSTVTTAGG